MAILNIIDENAIYEVSGSTTQSTIVNFQQKFIFENVFVKSKPGVTPPHNLTFKGTGLSNSITLPLLVKSSTTNEASHVYKDVPYIHSTNQVPSTFTFPNKDLSQSTTTTIKIKGTYVSDNAVGGGSTGPFWS